MANTISIILTAKDEASSVISGAGGAIEGLAAKAVTAAKIGIAALGTGLVVAGTAAIKSAGDFEQYRVAFETMLGSADKARSLLAQISDFAKATPFDLPEVVQASKQLLAFGFAQDQIIPTMRKLGDIAAGVGVPVGQLATVFGQVRTQGKLMGGDILQFTNAGVPIIENLSKVLHVSQGQVRDMVAAGKVGFPEVSAAIDMMTGSGSQFGGMMDKQSHTFQGTVSNIKDSFGQILRSAVGISNTGDIVAGGIFDRIKQAADAAMPKLDAFAQKVGPWMEAQIRRSSQAMYDFVTIFNDPKLTSQEVPTHFDNFVKSLRRVWDFIYGMFAPSIKALANAFSEQLGPSLKRLVPYLDDIGKILGVQLVAVLWLQINTVRVLVEGLSYAMRIFLAVKNVAVDAYSAMRAGAIDLAEVTVHTWQAIRDAAVTAWQAVYNVAVHPVMALIEGALRVVGGVAGYIWQWIYALAMAAWHPIYDNAVRPVLDAINAGLNWIGGVAQNVWNGILSVARPVFDAIGGAASGAWNWIVSVWHGAVNWFNKIFSDIQHAAEGPANGIAKTFDSIMETVKNTVKLAVNWIIHQIDNMIDGVNKVAGKVPGAPKMDKLAYLAQGGIFDKATSAIIAEDGPEAVVPLSKPNRAREVMQAAGLVQNSSAHTDNSRNFTFNVTQNINNTMDSSAAIKELEAMVAYA